MNATLLSNKKLDPIKNELFIRGRKLNIFFVFYYTILLCCSENSKQKELQQIVSNHSSDVEFQDFMNRYKKCRAKTYSFSVVDTNLTSDNSSRFRNKLLERI